MKASVFKNIYISLLLRFGIITMLFTISRILFYFFNRGYFQETGLSDLFAIFLYGIKFDLSSVAFINLLYIALQTIPHNIRYNKVYQKISEIIFYLTNSIALLFNCVDLVFYRFIFRRTTWDVLKGSFIGDDFRTVFLKYISDYWFVVLIWILLILIMIFLYRKTIPIFTRPIRGIRGYLLNSLWFALSISISIIIFRGGFQLRPISLVTAGSYTSPDNIPLLVNTPFSIFSTFEMSAINEKNYFSRHEAKKIFNPVIHPKPSNNKFRKLNVVILVVESLSEEYMGKLNKEPPYPGYKGFTPFLDSLIDYSRYFTYSFANGKRSIEGIPAIVSGMPALMNDAYLTSVFSGNKINSIPILLKKYGYNSSFFHGGKNGTMNFDAYAKVAGFDCYYGKNEYNNDTDYDGEWGIYDEPFLQFAAKTLHSTEQPFVSVIFTLSSHHPYSVPEKYKNTFSKGTLEIHESIGYTDFSIKEFFNTFSKMDFFDSTLFIITADHSSLAGTDYYRNPVGAFAVPILYYQHNSSFIGQQNTITSQSDIMPSILDFLHYPEPYVSFGKSVFDSCAPHFSVSLVNNTYQLIKDGYVLQFSNDKAIALFNLERDALLSHNLITSEVEKADELETFLKAYIQTFNERMIRNKLTDIDE